MISRRHFLESFASALGGTFIAGCEIEDAIRLADNLRCDTRLALLANLKEASDGFLKKALTFFAQERVDVVALIGPDQPKEKVAAFWPRIFGEKSQTRLISDDGQFESKGFAFSLSSTAPRRKAKNDTVTFFGEGRGPLTDELAFVDPVYRAVYAGSMSPLTIPQGYLLSGDSAETQRKVSSAQGLLVSVYSSQLTIRRLDFTAQPPKQLYLPRGWVYAEDVAPVVTLPREGKWSRSKPKAPQFWADTRLRIVPGYAGGSRVLTLTWPSVKRRFTGERAFCYEVGVSLKSPGETSLARPFRRRNVLANGYQLSETAEDAVVSTVFREDALKLALESKLPLVFSVTPIGPFGDRGQSVLSEPVNF